MRTVVCSKLHLDLPSFAAKASVVMTYMLSPAGAITAYHFTDVIQLITGQISQPSLLLDNPLHGLPRFSAF